MTEPNKTKPSLLVLAAGMGSRYGGLKQIDPIGPSGEAIIEYSMYDAIKAGFGKIVFVIRQSFEQAFKDMIGDKLDGLCEVKYVYQELDRSLGDFPLPQGREKPWGTGHAILVAADVINEPFAVINADDFYGGYSYKAIAEYLTAAAGENDYCMVGYTLSNTLSENGSVARGVCQCDDAGNLLKVAEHAQIAKNNSIITCLDDAGKDKTLTGEEVVSMNLWGFGPSIFTHLKTSFDKFLAEHGNEEKSEFYIPFVVDDLINQSTAKVKVLKSEASWFGITYPDDKPTVVAKLAELVDKGLYPKNLWEK
ncbi:MAG: nucleotidyltransferase [Planctomycetes bacterium]|nr:nucleotidyltransferase [Planctomycetota bacterium]